MGSVLLLYWRKLCEAFVALKKTDPISGAGPFIIWCYSVSGGTGFSSSSAGRERTKSCTST